MEVTSFLTPSGINSYYCIKFERELYRVLARVGQAFRGYSWVCPWKKWGHHTADHDTSSGVQVVLGGPMTRARGKKLKESMQALVCAIHDRVGHANVIQGLEEEETTRYTLIQVIESSEAKLEDLHED